MAKQGGYIPNIGIETHIVNGNKLTLATKRLENFPQIYYL